MKKNLFFRTVFTRSKRGRKLLMGVMLALLPLLLHGVETLPETVVYGKGSLTVATIEALREELSLIPGGIDVVDAESYKRGKAATLKDVLDYSPGVFVQPRFGAEEARISIRGSGIQRTFHGRGIKLMQDGVPVNLADGGFDFQAIEPLVAKAVEVYRGANALQFGSTTLGGAINFISPTGYDASPLALRAEYGSFGTVRGLISSGGVSGANDYFLSLSHLSQEGFRDHSRQSNQRLFTNVGHRFSENLETRFYLTLALTDSELPGNLTKSQLETDPRRAQRNGFVRIFDYVDSDWKRDFDLFRLANKTTWQDDDQKLTFTSFWSRKDLNHPILFVIDQLSNDFGVGLRYDNTAEVSGHSNRLTLGLTPTWGYIGDDRYDNVLGERGTKRASMQQRALNLDVFAEDQFWLSKSFAFTLGAQLSYAERSNQNAGVGTTNTAFNDNQNWWGFSPKLGLLFQPDAATQFFANVSRSFEPPSFGELVVAGTSATWPGGNPYAYLNKTNSLPLEAQTATTAEIGSRGTRGPFQWDSVYYFSWIENELLEFQIAPGVGQTKNAGKTIHQGIELGLGFDFLHSIADGIDPRKREANTRDRLVLQTHYLWNNFRYRNDQTYGNGPLAGIPEHYLRTDLTYSAPCGFYVGPNIECVPSGYRVDAAGTLFADAYFLFGAKAGFRRSSGLSFYIEGRNLANKRYAATTGVVSDAREPVNRGGSLAQFLPGDGRSFFLGIEYRW
jgi:iron complex outermembrane receptor protein